MEKRRIGSLEVSAVGLGCNNFGWRVDEARAREVVAAALDADVTFFDTADIYGGTESERMLGRALGARRDQVVIATKFGHAIDETRRGARPEYVRRACEASLARLGTDRIDLYQLHVPDPETPIADTLGALDDLVREGKVREIGCSKVSATQLEEALRATRPGARRLASVQNELSLVARDDERDVLPLCAREGVAYLPFFPLASGLLTGKLRRGAPPPPGTRLGDDAQRRAHVATPERLELIERLAAWAESRGRTLLELAFAWLLAHPEVASVIAGATGAAQVRANAAAGAWRLDDEERGAVRAILPGNGARGA